MPYDVVYMDPPYVPLTATSDFKSYTSDGFDIEDQRRVARTFTMLAERGVHVVASNSDTDVVRELYKDFEIRTVQARRNVNSKGSKRGPVNEVLVVARP
jgi:DNA adenine methylase